MGGLCLDKVKPEVPDDLYRGAPSLSRSTPVRALVGETAWSQFHLELVGPDLRTAGEPESLRHPGPLAVGARLYRGGAPVVGGKYRPHLRENRREPLPRPAPPASTLSGGTTTRSVRTGGRRRPFSTASCPFWRLLGLGAGECLTRPRRRGGPVLSSRPIDPGPQPGER